MTDMLKYIVLGMLLTFAACAPTPSPTVKTMGNEAQALHIVEITALQQAFITGGWDGWLSAAKNMGVRYGSVRFLGDVKADGRMIGMQARWENLQISWPSCFTTDLEVSNSRSFQVTATSWIHTDNKNPFNGSATVYPACRDTLELAPR